MHSERLDSGRSFRFNLFIGCAAEEGAGHATFCEQMIARLGQASWPERNVKRPDKKDAGRGKSARVTKLSPETRRIESRPDVAKRGAASQSSSERPTLTDLEQATEIFDMKGLRLADVGMCLESYIDHIGELCLNCGTPFRLLANNDSVVEYRVMGFWLLECML
jgi:hypothetical protein